MWFVAVFVRPSDWGMRPRHFATLAALPLTQQSDECGKIKSKSVVFDLILHIV